MTVLCGVPALVQLVHDAEDEHSALTRGCAWVRDAVGADGAGIVTHDAVSVIAAAGLAQRDLDDGDLRAALSVRTGRIVADGSRAIASAPMRHGGETIGFTVVAGRRDAAPILAEAGAALAAACAPALRATLDALALVGAGQALAPEILGASPPIAAIRDAIARAAVTTFPVLVEGESGTGKELVARALHRLSARRDRRFCAANCAALTDELVEAELFGHARGAFTSGRLSAAAASARTCCSDWRSCAFACRRYETGSKTFRCWRGHSGGR